MRLVVKAVLWGSIVASIGMVFFCVLVLLAKWQVTAAMGWVLFCVTVICMVVDYFLDRAHQE